MMLGGAQQAGNLRNTPQETVTTEEQKIAISTGKPRVVYVPEYILGSFYGAPWGLSAGPSRIFGRAGDFVRCRLGIGSSPGLAGADHWERIARPQRGLHHNPYISHGRTFVSNTFSRGHADFAHAGGFMAAPRMVSSASTPAHSADSIMERSPRSYSPAAARASTAARISGPQFPRWRRPQVGRSHQERGCLST